MTDRQWEIYEDVRDYTRTGGYPPTIREIEEMVGLSSSSTVYDHLKKIKSKGYITFEPGCPHALRVVK